MELLFDDQRLAGKLAGIREALLVARSLRLTEIAAQMTGSMAAAYKRIRRFLLQVDPHPLFSACSGKGCICAGGCD